MGTNDGCHEDNIALGLNENGLAADRPHCSVGVERYLANCNVLLHIVSNSTNWSRIYFRCNMCAAWSSLKRKQDLFKFQYLDLITSKCSGSCMI